MRRPSLIVVLAALLVGFPALVPAAPRQGPGAPIRVGGNIQAPKKIKDVPPEYPPDARRNRISGIVILEVTIDTEGKVSAARVIRSVAPLDQAALEAVRQWEFTPTLLNGEPVPIVMSVTVNFQLDGGAAPPAGLGVPPPAPPAAPPDCTLNSARRQAAVAFVRDVILRERLAAIEVQSKGFLPLSELRGLPPLPDGLDAQLTISGATYSVSVTDTRDACGFGVFSDQRGIIYVGAPVR